MEFSTRWKCLLLVAAMLAWGGLAHADPGRPGRLSPEERQQMRQQMREHWQQMPPEQRDYRRQELRDRWQQMPPDERQRWRDERRRRHDDGREGGWGGRGNW